MISSLRIYAKIQYKKETGTKMPVFVPVCRQKYNSGTENVVSVPDLCYLEEFFFRCGIEAVVVAGALRGFTARWIRAMISA